jgi:hypothetical protein
LPWLSQRDQSVTPLKVSSLRPLIARGRERGMSDE